jgi:hypothetical protein
MMLTSVVVCKPVMKLINPDYNALTRALSLQRQIRRLDETKVTGLEQADHASTCNLFSAAGFNSSSNLNP